MYHPIEFLQLGLVVAVLLLLKVTYRSIPNHTFIQIPNFQFGSLTKKLQFYVACSSAQSQFMKG